MIDTSLLPLFSRALEAEIGILVRCSDPKGLSRKLYALRAEVKDPALMQLIIFLPASNDKIFIAKKSVELEP